ADEHDVSNDGGYDDNLSALELVNNDGSDGAGPDDHAGPDDDHGPSGGQRVDDDVSWRDDDHLWCQRRRRHIHDNNSTGHRDIAAYDGTPAPGSAAGLRVVGG